MLNLRAQLAKLIIILVSSSFFFSALDAMDSEELQEIFSGSSSSSCEVEEGLLDIGDGMNPLRLSGLKLYVLKTSDPALIAQHLSFLNESHLNDEADERISALLDKYEYCFLSLAFFLEDGNKHFHELAAKYENRRRDFNYLKLPGMLLYTAFYDPYINKLVLIGAFGALGVAAFGAIQQYYIDHGNFNNPRIVTKFCKICAEIWYAIGPQNYSDFPIVLSNRTLIPGELFNQASCDNVREDAEELVSLLWQHINVSLPKMRESFATSKPDGEGGFLVYVLTLIEGRPDFIHSYTCSNSMLLNASIFLAEHFIPIAATTFTGIGGAICRMLGNQYFEADL